MQITTGQPVELTWTPPGSPPRVYSLICEGPCNSNLDVLDDHLIRGGQAVSTDVLMWIRRLRYTPHEMVGDNFARCQECQSVRRYGA